MQEKISTENMIDTLDEFASVELNKILESVTKHMLSESGSFKIKNWKTEEFLSEQVFQYKSEAQEVIKTQETPEDFLIVGE